MFSSKEIAEKALARVGQIKKARQRRRNSAIAIGLTLCICAASLLILMEYTDFDVKLSEQDQQIRYIAQPGVPLARPPTEHTCLCPECGAEIEPEAEYCCICEEEVECELCRRE